MCSLILERKIKNVRFVGKTFPQAGKLKTHILTDTGYKDHKCNVCDKTFSQRIIINVRFVAKLFPMLANYRHMSSHILELMIINAMFVAKPFPGLAI